MTFREDPAYHSTDGTRLRGFSMFPARFLLRFEPAARSCARAYRAIYDARKAPRSLSRPLCLCSYRKSRLPLLLMVPPT